MNWFIVDYEVAIYGKDCETVLALDEDTAKSVALAKIEKEKGFRKENIEIVSCKIVKS